MRSQKQQQITLTENFTENLKEKYGKETVINVFKEKFRDQVHQELKERGLTEKAKNFKKCCKEELIARCKNCGSPVAVPIGCKLRICPECRIKENHKLKKRYEDVVSKFRMPKLLTLTIKNVEHLNGKILEKARNDFSRFRRRVPIKKRLFGGLYAFDVKKTKNSAGWNIHIHALVEMVYFDQKKLSNLWEEITGNSKIVDIRQVKNTERGLDEVLNYVAKEGEITNISDLVTYEDVMANRKQIQTFGKIYDKTNRANFERECKECGFNCWEFMGIVGENRTKLIVAKDEAGLRDCLSSLDTRKQVHTEKQHLENNTTAKPSYEEKLTKAEKLTAFVNKNPDYETVVNRFGKAFVDYMISRGLIFEPKPGILKVL